MKRRTKKYTSQRMKKHNVRKTNEIEKKENKTVNAKDKSNGFFISNLYMPEELLIVILCHVEKRALLNCKLVCKSWYHLIQTSVLHRKAELITGQTLPFNKHLPPKIYYCLCDKMPFKKNLIKNHSGENGTTKYWRIPPIGRQMKWFTESSPVPQLPDDPLFTGDNPCYAITNSMTWKFQVVDLIKEGFSEFLLDYLQPAIKISEWYCCENSPSVYVCDIELLEKDGLKKTIYYDEHNKIVSNDHFIYSKIMRNDEKKKWFKVFKNYGKGLRKIKFTHGGTKICRLDQIDVKNGYVTKIARACVIVEIPLMEIPKNESQ